MITRPLARMLFIAAVTTLSILPALCQPLTLQVAPGGNDAATEGLFATIALERML